MGRPSESRALNSLFCIAAAEVNSSSLSSRAPSQFIFSRRRQHNGVCRARYFLKAPLVSFFFQNKVLRVSCSGSLKGCFLAPSKGFILELPELVRIQGCFVTKYQFTVL